MALPAFTVRSYPAFRPARLYRMLVSPDSLYFIRLGGLVSPSDAGYGHSLDPGKRAVAALIGWFAKKSLDAGLAEIEGTDPGKLVASDKKHFMVTPDELIDSRLDSPSLFSRQLPCFAPWKVAVLGRKPVTYKIEDKESLETAMTLLPPLLRDKLRVTVGIR